MERSTLFHGEIHYKRPFSVVYLSLHSLEIGQVHDWRWQSSTPPSTEPCCPLASAKTHPHAAGVRAGSKSWKSCGSNVCRTLVFIRPSLLCRSLPQISQRGSWFHGEWTFHETHAPVDKHVRRKLGLLEDVLTLFSRAPHEVMREPTCWPH